MTALANHLWQSTLFTAAALLLTLALRGNRAHVRYTIWLAASIKFLVPLSLFFAIGSRLRVPVAAPTAPVVDRIGSSLAPDFAGIAAVAVHAPPAALPNLLLAIWMCGAAGLLLRWYLRWRPLRNALRRATPLNVTAGIPVLASPASIEPGVLGIFRPVLLVPEGLTRRLTSAQWDAILNHELCHVRRRDNLASAIHMVVEAVFWFHPAVWWIGSRLLEERERACDEQVLRQGGDPEVYASGILTVCRVCMESPLACAAGVTGADLKHRVEAIMSHRVHRELTITRKALLTFAAAAAIAGPIWFGVIDTPSLRAQTAVIPGLKFDVASIKPYGDATGRVGFDILPGGGFRAHGMTAHMLIAYAYNVQDSLLTGGPKWINSDGYDIAAKPDRTDDPPGTEKMTADERLRARMRALLADRFHLEVHTDTKQQNAWVLTVAKGGAKLSPTKQDAPPGLNRGPGTLISRAASMYHLCSLLSHWLGMPVLDRTGIQGLFDYTVNFEQTPDDRPGPGAPPPDSFFAALEDQVGLKLERTRTSVESVIVDHVEKPSAN